MSKLYSPEEANALLPHLAPALVELQAKYEQAAEAQAQIMRSAAGNGWSSKRDSWSRVIERVAVLFGRLQEWEVELKDVSIGLVDFPTVIGGQDAYLCWRLGEPEVAYWHPRDGGFAGRRPL